MKHPKSYTLPACPLSSCSQPRSPTSSSTADGTPEKPTDDTAGVSVEFVELLARSNFSFLQGASHPEEMVLRARALGYRGLGICDVNGLYGIVRGYQAVEKPSSFDSEQMSAVESGVAGRFRYLCGAELTLYDSSPLILMPMNKEGYTRLCRLLTLGKRQAPKGHFVLSLQDVLTHNEDLLVFPLPPWNLDHLARLKEAFQDRIYLPVWRDFTWDSVRLYQQALQIESSLGLKLFATLRPLFHSPERKQLHDVLTCVLHKTTLDEAATRLTLNSERHLKELSLLREIFHERPDLIQCTLEIAARVDFSLAELRYKYPREYLPPGKNASEFLRELAERGLEWRFPGSTTPATERARARELLEHELGVIRELEYEDYFLTLWDICQFASQQGILHQGRGSAANSIVCFTLGLTAANPVRLGLLFERFISKGRREPPDIDVDFEHARREEVIQYIYNKYGEHRAAMVCTVIRYRSRMAVREVAKTLGVDNKSVDALVKYMGREGLSRLMEFSEWDGQPPAGKELSAGEPPRVPAVNTRVPTTPRQSHQLELRQLGLSEQYFRILVRMAYELQGFPRHLGIHTGGFVISHEALVDIVPVEAATMNRRFVVQWNKDDINTLGMMKVDVLALGMLTAIQKTFALLRAHKDVSLDLASIPHDDFGTYQMIQKADTIGVFQIESRAQMSLLPRLKPKNYYDLVIEVAIVRPGPIQGGMVHPFLRRRTGKERVTYAHPCLQPILEKTLGVPLFQEQVMQIAVQAAGFSPDEADDLRRIMSSAWRKKAVMGNIRQRVVSGMLTRGIARDYAEQIYKTIEGFSSYGFPESHAASFALITYVSCYLKHHHPDAFACALLNSQPMGFYSPRQLIADAQRHQVRFLPLDVQTSEWDYTLVTPPATKPPLDLRRDVRVGFRSVYGLRQEHALNLIRERQVNGPFRDLSDLVRRSRVPRHSLIRLAEAGALHGLDLNARQALWELQGTSFDEQSLFFGSQQGLDHDRRGHEKELLPVENPWENLQREYQSKGFAIDSHPLAVLRPTLLRTPHARYITAKQLADLKHRTPVRVAGLMCLLQKPPTAKGMCFVSLEDETGIMNLVITPDLYQKTRLTLLSYSLIDVEGRLENIEGVRNIRAFAIHPLKDH